MITFARIFRFGVQNFWRNIWLSLVTVLIVTLNLFLMSVVMGLDLVGQQTLDSVRDKVSLSVYFTATTSEQRVDEIRQAVQQKPEVASAVLVTRQQHLDNLKKSDRVDQTLINKAIDAIGDNPLGAGIVVKAKALDGYTAIETYFKDPQYSAIIDTVDQKSLEDNLTLIKGLENIVPKVARASIWLVLVFSLIAMLMVYNTIRVTIYAQREEIGIMKLVGASDAFVRGPFLVASVLYGLLASLLNTVILVPVLTLSNGSIMHFFGGISILDYVQAHLLVILGVEVLIGCLLSFVSSLFNVGRYLRV